VISRLQALSQIEIGGDNPCYQHLSGNAEYLITAFVVQVKVLQTKHLLMSAIVTFATVSGG
jgi:hypothetical protein